ncbi:Uncharacterised protein [uncultured archaeon]|nr:Uncharacterised protein [uncultured archaeon]
MSYVCIECGSEFEYADVVKNRLQCVACREKRSNIWYKRRPQSLPKMILAR